MTRGFVGRVVIGTLVWAPIMAGCGSSAGSPSAAPPPAGTPAEAAPAGLSLPCQPGSGRQVTSPGPMNLTDLSGQDLSCAVFDHLTMNQVKLREAKLPGAAFQAANLNQVNFTGASLVGAVFDGSTLNFPDFTNTDLRGAKLTGAHLNNPVWTGATCPDGATGASCDGHLTPLPATAGPATPAPTTTTTTTAAPPPPPPPAGTQKPPANVPTAPAVFNGPTDGTYACTGGNVAINGLESDIHLVGQCELVTVNGAKSHVEIDNAHRIVVNGANADVIYHNQAQVSVNGRGATARRA